MYVCICFFKFELLLFCFCELQPWSIDWIEKGRFVISSHFKSVFHQISPDFHNYFIPLQFRISIVELPSKAAAPPGPLFTLKVELCFSTRVRSHMTSVVTAFFMIFDSPSTHVTRCHYFLPFPLIMTSFLEPPPPLPRTQFTYVFVMKPTRHKIVSSTPFYFTFCLHWNFCCFWVAYKTFQKWRHYWLDSPSDMSW